MTPGKASLETKVAEVIGDCRAFFADLLERLGTAGVDIRTRPLTHLLYRTETDEEYEGLRDRLRPLCARFVETWFNGRPVAVMIFKEPLQLANGFTVQMLELPAPRTAHTYPSGLESVGVMLGDDLAGFKKDYERTLTGVKDHGHYCRPAFLTFENGKTVRFYDRTLEEIISREGWRFEQIGEPADSEANRVAEIVNGWRKYLYQAPGWQELIRGVEPKQTGCGPVYEISNRPERPGESFAIADMRGGRFTDAHYHHKMTEIYMVLEGSGTVVVAGKAQEVEPDVTVVIPPDHAHFTLPKGLVVAAINTPPFEAEDYLVLEESNEAVGFDKAQYARMVKEAGRG